MKLLLDTHTLLWWWSQADRIAPRVRALLRDPANTIFVSAASAWEVATKYRIGKYPDGGRVIGEWGERMAPDGFIELPISARHALRAGSMPGEHRDPFDRMIAAQSLIEGVPVASSDRSLTDLGAERVWE